MNQFLAKTMGTIVTTHRLYVLMMWWAFMVENMCCLLAVSHRIRCNESVHLHCWQKKREESLTALKGWDVVKLPDLGEKERHCDSHAVGHGDDQNYLAEKMVLSHTSCRSWNVMWWHYLAKIKCFVTCFLYVMGQWDTMGLLEEVRTLSPTYC